MFFNRVVAPFFLKRPGDAAIADAAERNELPPILDYLERTVPDADAFLIADRLTLADIAVASPFANLLHLKLDLDESRYPRTLAYVRSILDRPSFRSWVDRETAFLAKVAA